MTKVWTLSASSEHASTYNIKTNTNTNTIQQSITNNQP